MHDFYLTQVSRDGQVANLDAHAPGRYAATHVLTDIDSSPIGTLCSNQL
jgi:hypothetical protein